MTSIFNPERERLATQVMTHMQAVNAPQAVIDDFYEVYVFISINKLQSMTSWNRDQFIIWHEAKDATTQEPE